MPFNAESVRQTTQKIKRGIYTIPNTMDPLLKDLIQKILVVDPKKRITIDQIKAHPAFHIDLPKDYILPKPFPLPQLSDPIQISENDAEAINCLKQVGFHDMDELMSLLQAPSPNMAKVFFFMLTQRQNVDNIPWDKAISAEAIAATHENENNNDIPSLPRMGSITLYEHQFGGFNSPGIDFINPLPSSSASLCESFENAQQWLGGNITQTNIEEHVIQHINTNATEIMSILQTFLLTRNFDFFHPDYEQLVAKNKQNNLCITLNADYENEAQMELSIQFNSGPTELFNSFVNQIMNLITKLMDSDSGLYSIPE